MSDDPIEMSPNQMQIKRATLLGETLEQYEERMSSFDPDRVSQRFTLWLLYSDATHRALIRRARLRFGLSVSEIDVIDA